MVRLRTLGSEVYSPSEIAEGLQLTMPYLHDMRAFQAYMDGDLSPIYQRFSAPQNAAEQNRGHPSRLDDATGYHLYKATGGKAVVEVNLFKAVERAVVQAVFSDLPKPIDAGDDIQAQWEVDSRQLLREARRAVAWLVAKGRGVMVAREQLSGAGTMIAMRAVDPAGYLPIKHRLYRDQAIGHALINWSYNLPRQTASDIASDVAIDVWVSEDDVANADGYIAAPINEIRRFAWNGGEPYSGVLGTARGIVPSRVRGLWTIGDDDSIFASMESLAFNAMMDLTHARTAMTRDVRSVQIRPQIVEPHNLAPDGTTLHIDGMRPTLEVPADEMTGSGFGYSPPPGPEIAAAFLQLFEQHIHAMSYATGVTPEAIGEGYLPQEPAAAFNAIRQAFLVWVMEIRDDVGKILSEAWELTGGPAGANIGWEQAPYVDTQALDDRVIKLLQAGLIDVATGQAMAGLPIVEIEVNDGSEGYNGGSAAPDRDGRNGNHSGNNGADA